MVISWWGNIRFEEAFEPDLCRLLAASGMYCRQCRLGSGIGSAACGDEKGYYRGSNGASRGRISIGRYLIHAYLMYGFPGETISETVESLERVRQLFAHRFLQSAFWHRFVATAHSPVGLDPAAHGVLIAGPRFGGFAENDLKHHDPVRRGARLAWRRTEKGALLL